MHCSMRSPSDGAILSKLCGFLHGGGQPDHDESHIAACGLFYNPMCVRRVLQKMRLDQSVTLLLK